MRLLGLEHASKLEELMKLRPGMDPVRIVWGDDEGRYEWVITDSTGKPVLVSMNLDGVSYADETMTYRNFCLRILNLN